MLFSNEGSLVCLETAGVVWHVHNGWMDGWMKEVLCFQIFIMSNT